MSKKSRTSKNSRAKRTEPTVAVMLTGRDLIVLQQAVDDRMSVLNKGLMEAEGEGRDWQVAEVARDHELNKKRLDAAEEESGALPEFPVGF